MTFLRDTWRALLAGAIILGVLWFGVHQLQEAREARGAAEAESVRADSLEAAKAVSDSIAADSIASLVAAREASEAREAQATREAERAAERVREASQAVDLVITDTVTIRLIDEERMAHEAEKAALRAENMELRAQVILADQTIDVLRERIEESDELIASLRQEADAWERAANPGIVGRIVGQVPAVLAGAGSLLLVLALL